MSEVEIVVRLVVAAVAGGLLGLDRELRGIAAGLRTHAMASLSSAVIVVVSLALYAELTTSAGEPATDPLRAIQGLAQAIGFVAAGAIFFARGEVHNLTSAANIWLAAGLGIAAGAGQYVLVATALVLGVVIISGIRVIERFLPRPENTKVDDAGASD